MFIYKVTNLLNGKIYIGQTINNLHKRWREHKSSKNCRSLKRSIIKHGSENFKIEEIDGANSLSELNYKEWLWICKLDCIAPNGYNLKDGGGNKRYSDESKQKMSKSQKGHKTSEETKIKISKSKIGSIPWNKDVKGIVKRSQEIKEKMSKSWNPKSVEGFKVKTIDLATKIVYESVTEMSKEMKIPRRTLVRLLNKKVKPSDKYKNINVSYWN